MAEVKMDSAEYHKMLGDIKDYKIKCQEQEKLFVEANIRYKTLLEKDLSKEPIMRIEKTVSHTINPAFYSMTQEIADALMGVISNMSMDRNYRSYELSNQSARDVVNEIAKRLSDDVLKSIKQKDVKEETTYSNLGSITHLITNDAVRNLEQQLHQLKLKSNKHDAEVNEIIEQKSKDIRSIREDFAKRIEDADGVFESTKNNLKKENIKTIEEYGTRIKLLNQKIDDLENNREERKKEEEICMLKDKLHEIESKNTALQNRNFFQRLFNTKI